MESLEYAMAWWWTLRKLIVASVVAGRSCRGLHSWPLRPQGGGLGLGNFLAGGARLVARGGGTPRLNSRGISPVYLVPLSAFFPGDKRRMGWALVSSKVSTSALSGAGPWLSWGWRCHCT